MVLCAGCGIYRGGILGFYIRVGDSFTPIEAVNRIQSDLLHVKYTPRNRYITLHTPKRTEVIELDNGEATYYTAEILFADMVNGFDILLGKGGKEWSLTR